MRWFAVSPVEGRLHSVILHFLPKVISPHGRPNRPPGAPTKCQPHARDIVVDEGIDIKTDRQTDIVTHYFIIYINLQTCNSAHIFKF